MKGMIMEDDNIILCKLLGMNYIFEEILSKNNNGETIQKYIKKNYIDFTTPNNFIKLLEIMNSIGYDLRVDKLLNYRQAIIRKAIYLASTNQSHFKEEKATFKQQAHSREWEY